MKSVLVELVSNASTDIYPSNTLASFTNFFPEEILLDGNWQVALVQVTFPALYYNITDGKFCFKHTEKNDKRESTTDSKDEEPMEVDQNGAAKNDDNEQKAGESYPATGLSSLDVVEASNDFDYSFKMNKGVYHNLTSIEGEMNNAITRKEIETGRSLRKSPTDKRLIRLQLNQQNLKLNVQLLYQEASLFLKSDDLKQILGIAQSRKLKGRTHESDYTFDIARFHTLMIYSDIVEYTIVGDVKVPLLRSISHIPRMKNFQLTQTQQVIDKTFTNLQFKKVLKTTIHSINIQLRTDTGLSFPFAGTGTTRLTLEFRKFE